MYFVYSATEQLCGFVESKRILVRLPIGQEYLLELATDCFSSFIHKFDGADIIRLDKLVGITEFGKPSAINPHNHVGLR